MSRLRGRPFDIVHLAQTTFPDDPRPRREAMIAADTGARVAIIVLQGESPRAGVSRHGPLTVIRIPGVRRRGSAAGYMFDYVDFLWRARRLIRGHYRLRHARVFHVHTLPDFLVAATPERRHGARVILDLHEVFPEFTQSRFRGWKGRIGAIVARRLEAWSRRRADITLTVNETVAERLRQRPARQRESIVVVHNFADPAVFGPAKLTDGKTQVPLRLVYHGTITRLYGLDLAVDAVGRARNLGLGVRFDIFGSGPDRDLISTMATNAGLGELITLHGPVPVEELRDRLPTYHAGLITTRLDVMTRFSLSTKLLEYVHLGIPVIAPAIPTYVQYLPPPALWYFRPNDPADAANVLMAFANARPNERIARARQAQVEAAAALDPERDSGRLREAYQRLLFCGPPARSAVRRSSD